MRQALGRPSLFLAPPAHHKLPGDPKRRSRARCVSVRNDAQQPACLAKAESQYNNITVLQIPDAPHFPDEVRGARLLILDDSGNVHSVWRPDTTLTGQYWDVMSSLPSFIPEGPISILGLGAGSVARLIHQLYPDRKMEGWELDPVVLMMARMHLGLEELLLSGCLVGHTGDALDPAAAIAGGSAGILVDLFSGGALLPALTQASTWSSIRSRLRPEGRVMANLGAAPHPGQPGQVQPGTVATMKALEAMADAFEGQVTYAELVKDNTANMIAVTGPPFTKETLSRSVPDDLKQVVQLPWRAWH